ncbi:isoform II [Streptomyces sp. S4.7]|uniref:alpha/beta hydrolase family protein n=1 Tax=Streptomyces sp. S4.7 TaxID=2705439 RepID=UPI001398FADD|nr:lipase [Streptomyces sp. S4.7]QHY97341.1 isoform II [Streptomyces sp. S4.7]
MTEMTRRSVLAAAGTAGLLLTTAGMAQAEGLVPRAALTDRTKPTAVGPRKGRVQLTLPVPTGPWRIGTTSLHLIDRSRRDPWTSPSAARELMISMWYPTSNTHGCRRAPWLPPATTELYRQQVGQELQTPLDNVDFPVTHACLGVTVEAHLHGHPVVLFSPGYGAMRELCTALVEDLASHGYVVVTIDHTHEASMVEFPGGRLELSRQPAQPTDDDIATALRVRQDDTRFVLNELALMNAGKNPDAERRRLPHGLRGSLDLSRIGMFGHSLGGDTAAETMAQDRRILAGVDLDGSINGTVAATGLDRPFLLMSNADHGRHNDPSWAEFWSHLRGWHLDLRLRRSGHHTYTDLSPLAQQLEKALPIPPEVVAALTTRIGTINADRAVAAERAYLSAFFDLHLRDQDDHLLSGPSPRYPDIEFVR